MKKYIYTFGLLCFLNSSVQAQVLWSENFDSFTTGNMGIINDLYIPSPVAGQNDWYLYEVAWGIPIGNFVAKIEPEINRGNVLNLIDIPVYNAVPPLYNPPFLYVYKKEQTIDSLWNQRTPGNNILKFEYDFYSGRSNGISAFPYRPLTSVSLHRTKKNNDVHPESHTEPIRNYYDGSNQIFGLTQDGTSQGIYSPVGRWVKVVIYADYNTKYRYIEIPSMNVPALRSVDNRDIHNEFSSNVNAVFIHFASDVLMDRSPYFVKFDNLKMSAVNTLPLSLKKLAAATFTIFPNPATDVVTITNAENIGVKQIDVYDISGKMVKSQKGNSENEMQLNMESFAPGTYFLHIQTNEGTAVEKIVKK